MKEYKYRYPRPAVTVDLVIVDEGKILLIQRAEEPCKGQWALPGGFVDENEDLPDAAARELLEETNLQAEGLLQVGAFGKPGRDPRGHTISIAFKGSVKNKQDLKAADDAQAASWFELVNLPELAFDHQEIIAQAVK